MTYTSVALLNAITDCCEVRYTPFVPGYGSYVLELSSDILDGKACLALLVEFTNRSSIELK